MLKSKSNPANTDFRYVIFMCLIGRWDRGKLCTGEHLVLVELTSPLSYTKAISYGPRWRVIVNRGQVTRLNLDTWAHLHKAFILGMICLWVPNDVSEWNYGPNLPLSSDPHFQHRVVSDHTTNAQIVILSLETVVKWLRKNTRLKVCKFVL